ncbi:SusD/RagB family nutrient-binding outer membrane lipoprotein [Phocaeicola sp.]
MKRKSLYTLIAGALLCCSCTDWLDINHSPNDPLEETVTKDLLLSFVENDMNADRTTYHGLENMAQHLTKSGTVSGTYPFLTGLLAPQNSNDYWSSRYTRIMNLKSITKKAIEEGNAGYEGISGVLTVINFRELVDIFCDVPYTEAALGNDYLAPKYDNGPEIYAALLKDIDTAISKLEEALNDPTYSIGTLKKADIFCNGDLKQWVRYAYSIKLSLLMRISDVQDVAAQVDAIKDKGLEMNEIIAANPGYYKAEYKMNHTYEYWGWSYLDNEKSYHKQVVPTTQLVDELRNNNDPRLRVYIDPRRSLDEDKDGKTNYKKHGLDKEYYIGIPYGQLFPAGGDYASRIGLGVLAKSSSKIEGPKNDIYVMSGSLIGFYLAEAALRGMIGGGDAQAKAYYEKAVTSAMKMYEVALQDNGYPLAGVKKPISGSAEEAAAEYLAQDNKAVNWDLMTTTEEKMCAIQTQKWISLFMIDPLEAWSEQRRTDYPVLKISHSQAKGQKLIIRLPYPNTEKNLNPNNFKEIDIFEDLIFWDKKNEPRETVSDYL